MLINVSYLAAMSPIEMVESEAVAVTFGNRILGAFAWIMPLSVTISTFGSANGTLFAAGRYGNNLNFKFVVYLKKEIYFYREIFYLIFVEYIFDNFVD